MAGEISTQIITGAFLTSFFDENAQKFGLIFSQNRKQLRLIHFVEVNDMIRDNRIYIIRHYINYFTERSCKEQVLHMFMS